MTALRDDISAARNSIKFAKGSDVKPASVMDLKAWLDSAVKSPTDGTKAFKPAGVPVGSRMVPLDKKSLDKVLSNLDTAAASAARPPPKGGDTKRPSQAELREWVTNALVQASVGQIQVVAKGGATRPATADEIRGWLN
ncbi:MAG: hypothetical protein QM817_35370 [Archangium sp.]